LRKKGGSESNREREYRPRIGAHFLNKMAPIIWSSTSPFELEKRWITLTQLSFNISSAKSDDEEEREGVGEGEKGKCERMRSEMVTNESHAFSLTNGSKSERSLSPKRRYAVCGGREKEKDREKKDRKRGKGKLEE